MSDLRRVEVVFKSETTENKPSEKIKNGEKNQVIKQEETKWWKNVLVQQTRNYVKTDIQNIASYEINKWFTLTDDYIGQRTLTNAINVVSRVKNIALSIKAGAIVGGPVGAAIAAVGNLASLGISIAQNYDQSRILVKQMDAQLAYQRQRAGYSLTSGRVGENK